MQGNGRERAASLHAAVRSFLGSMLARPDQAAAAAIPPDPPRLAAAVLERRRALGSSTVDRGIVDI